MNQRPKKLSHVHLHAAIIWSSASQFLTSADEHFNYDDNTFGRNNNTQRGLNHVPESPRLNVGRICHLLWSCYCDSLTVLGTLGPKSHQHSQCVCRYCLIWAVCVCVCFSIRTAVLALGLKCDVGVWEIVDLVRSEQQEVQTYWCLRTFQDRFKVS